MSEAAMEAVEAGTSRRRSARLKRDRTEDTEQPSATFDSGVVQNRNSNGVAAGSRGARSGRVKQSTKEAAGRTDTKAATPAVANTPRANTPRANTPRANTPRANTPRANTPRANGRRSAAAATNTKEPETVSAYRMQGKAAGVTNKSNATSVRPKSNTLKQSQSRKEVPQSSRATSRVNRRATYAVKPQSANSQSRKSRRDTAHGNDSLEESFSDESHSESCSTCSDGGDSISCSCSDCEFEDFVRGKKPAPKKKTLKVVREYSDIHTPD